LYRHSTPRAARTPTRVSTAVGPVAGEQVSVIGFKGVQGGIEEIALCDDDDVEAWREFVATENLSNQAFGSISPDGAAQLPGCGNAQPADAAFVGQQEDRRIPAMDFDAVLVDPFELGSAANPLCWPETQLLAADGQPFPSLRAAPLQHETTVFRAHSDEKPVRSLAVTRIRLKRADSLGHDIPSW
jgi:hypothetical protein